MAPREMRLVLTVDDFDDAMAFFRDALGSKRLDAFQDGDGRGVIVRLLGSEGTQLTLFTPLDES